MENVRIKAHVTPQQFKDLWPENKLIYTFEVYLSSRVWDQSIISQAIFIGIDFQEYRKLMKIRFDSCIEYGVALFFQTKQQCEEAIEFFDSLLTLKKLTK
ncbi:hypothetical protein D3C71_1357440 [compost metagenome]